MNIRTIATDLLSAFSLVCFCASAGFLVAHVKALSERPASCPSPAHTYIHPTK